MINARKTANCSFPGITHISDIIEIYMLLAVYKGKIQPPHRTIRSYLNTFYMKKKSKKFTTKIQYVASYSMAIGCNIAHGE